MNEYIPQVERLLELVGTSHPRYKDIWALKIRLERNLHKSQVLGDPQQRESDRAEILLGLTEISLSLFGAPLDGLTEDSKLLETAETSGEQTTQTDSGLPALLNRLKPEPALLSLFNVIDRARSNHDLSPEQVQSLKAFLSGIMIKKERGEKPMPPAHPENTGEMFSYSSEILAFHLLSLSEYHITWQSLSLGDTRKEHSLVVLHELDQHVLKSSALVEQTVKDHSSRKVLSDAQKIISAAQSLRITLADIDKYLYSGDIPFEVKDEMEKYYDDLFYYLSNYIVRLREFAGQSGYRELIQ